MPLADLHYGALVATFAPLQGMIVRRETDPSRMAAVQQRDVTEMQRRFEAGHHAYVAELDGAPAAWGWVATRSAVIGELAASFTIAPRERYLWNFVTLAAFRGRGIYPRLLASIIEAESADAERFWIAWAPENHASGAGIRKIGFETAAELSFDASGRPALQDRRPGGAALASRLLALPLATEPLQQCWRCAKAARPSEMSCREGSCSCDYQIPASGCAA